MKDTLDNATGDLIASTDRKARYEARRRAAGWRRVAVWQKATDWQAGFDAGLTGAPASPVPVGLDGLSWVSGWIEGDAKRQQGD